MKWKKSVLPSALSLRNKQAVSKAGDPTTKNGDKTLTSCGKQVRQLARCIECAKGFITSFPFSPTVLSLLPSGQRGYYVKSKVAPGFTCICLLEDEALQITKPSFIRVGPN